MIWNYCDYIYEEEELDLSVDPSSGETYTLDDEGDHKLVKYTREGWRCYYEASHRNEYYDKKYCEYPKEPENA